MSIDGRRSELSLHNTELWFTSEDLGLMVFLLVTQLFFYDSKIIRIHTILYSL